MKPKLKCNNHHNKYEFIVWDEDETTSTIRQETGIYYNNKWNFITGVLYKTKL